MKPLKGFSLAASWLMRVSILIFMFVNFWQVFKQINVEALSIHTLLVGVYGIFGLLLFVGGFRSKQGLTVLSGLIISLLSVYFSYIAYDGNLMNPDLVAYLFPFSIGLFFLSNGNK